MGAKDVRGIFAPNFLPPMKIGSGAVRHSFADNSDPPCVFDQWAF